MCLIGIRHAAASFVVALLLAGCGGGGGGADPGTDTPTVQAAPVGDPVVQTVGAGGGTVEATASGVKVRLSFPAGALAANTAITVTPQALAAGEVASMKLAPGGVFFAKPVTVVLEYPAGKVPAAAASMRQHIGSTDSYIVTAVDASARTLTARLITFGGPSLDALANPASALAGRARALSAKTQADASASQDGSFAADESTPLADMIASIRRQVTIMENSGDFEAAFALQANIASLLNRRGDIDYAVTGTPFIKEAHDTACAALSSAMADARAARPVKAAEFKPLREKIGNWWVIADQTNIFGAGCAGAMIEDFSAAAIDLTQRETALQFIELGKVKVAVDAEKQKKIDEAAAALKAARKNMLEVELLEDAARALDLPPLPPQSAGRSHAVNARALAVQDSGYAAIIRTELLDPLMAPAREAAWTMAKGSAMLAQYPVLLDAFGSAPALQQDVQFVLTRISARIIDSGGNTLASSTLGFEVVPELPADPKRIDTLTLRRGSTLALSGNIANLECAAAGVETLTATFEGVQVASVSGSGGNLLAGALATLTPAGLLSAAGLPADDTASHTLRIRRAVSPCAAALGLTDDLLATVTLKFSDARIAFVRGNAIYVINPDGSNEQRVTDGSAIDASPAWSPDRTRIAFSRSPTSFTPAYIFVVNVDGTGLVQLTSSGNTRDDLWPAWSPDGKRIAFTRIEPITFNGHTFLMSDTGTNLTPLTLAFRAFWPTWSPDGTLIAFGVDNGGLSYMGADGGVATQLIIGSGASLGMPVWSPDGTRIAFSTEASPTIHFVSVSSGGVSDLGLPAGRYNVPAWSPDGRQMAVFNINDGNIYTVKLDGTGLTLVTSGTEPAW